MLFDIQNDPGEKHDLSEEKPELLQQFKNQLNEIKTSWLKSREGQDYTF